jgi:hypothetical protein
MPWQPSDLATIDAAIASGAKEVHYQDRTVVYPSVEDMMKSRTVINNYLMSLTTPPPTRQIRVFTDKGWGGC